MKNNYGFTLVELLATIVVIGLLASIGVVAYTNIIKRSQDVVFQEYQDTMKVEAEYYLIDHDISNTTISLSDLNMEKIKNPVDSDDYCPNSYVEVTKISDETNDYNKIHMQYKVCLICNSFNNCKTYDN